MYLRAPIVRIKIGNRFFFETGDSYLQSAEVILSENERASSCSFSIYDPGLKVLNLLLLEFQQHGGIYIPANLLSDPSQSAAAGGGDGTSLSFASGAGAVAYIKDIEAKYGTSDLSGLTATGKTASEALINENVRAFLNAVAIAELGDKDGAPGKGYGYLFGDTNGKETFDPRTLTSHPKRRRSASGLTSSATGRYQTLDLVWEDDAYGYRKLGLKDFKPVSQEILAVGRLMYRGILEDVVAGRFEQAIQGSGYGKGARYEWASLQGNPYGQGTSGGKRSTFLANIQRFLAASPKKASATTTTATKAPNTAAASLVSASLGLGGFAPSLPFSLDTTPTPKELPFKPPANSVSTVEQSIMSPEQVAAIQSKATGSKKEIVLDVKEGVLVYIETAFNDGLSFIHQFFLTSVRGSNEVPHTTKIGGNQLRYVLARGAKLAGSAGKIYKIRENTTIRQVANEVTGKVGAKVGELSELADIIFEKSYQAESDYEYLLRLARESGLFLRSNGSSLDIKPLASTDRKITINAKVLMQGSRWGDFASEARQGGRLRHRRILSVPSTNVIQRSQAEDDTERDAASADEGENQTVALTVTAKKNPLTAAAGGILALTQSAATSEQIGRGFEGQLIINSVLLPVILEVQPGQIVDLDKDTGLGEALIRGYRIGEVRHKYTNNKIITTLDIYLPVKVKPPVRKIQVTDSAAPVAAGNITIPTNLQGSPKTGDAIAQYRVSSPYGPRTPPKTATGYGTKIHQGVDVPMPIGTPLYPICNPGETVNVTKSSGGGGGLVAEFRQGEWIFQYMHLSEVFTGVRKYGEPICKSGNSGNSSGPHLHFTQRKASDRSTVPPAAGYIFFAVTGRSPS